MRKRPTTPALVVAHLLSNHEDRQLNHNHYNSSQLTLLLAADPYGPSARRGSSPAASTTRALLQGGGHCEGMAQSCRLKVQKWPILPSWPASGRSRLGPDTRAGSASRLREVTPVFAFSAIYRA
jgi:hypothetical protein